MRIVAVSQHLTRGPMDATINELGIAYPVAVDEDRDTWDNYGMRVYPSWAIIGADGELVHRQAGAVDSGGALAFIEQELAKLG